MPMNKLQRGLLWVCAILAAATLGVVVTLAVLSFQQGGVVGRLDDQATVSTCRSGLSAEANIADARGMKTFLEGLSDGFEDGELSGDILDEIDVRIEEQDRVIQLYERLDEICPPPGEEED